MIARLAAPIPVDVVGDTRQEFNPLPVFEPVGIVPTPVVEVVPAKASVEVVAGYTKQAEVERKKAQSREYMRAYRERKRKKS